MLAHYGRGKSSTPYYYCTRIITHHYYDYYYYNIFIELYSSTSFDSFVDILH